MDRIDRNYYLTDVGLRNAQLNFRQQEETHPMENVIYNELCVRGFNATYGRFIPKDCRSARPYRAVV